MGQLFSKKNKEVFSAPLGIDNPVTVQAVSYTHLDVYKRQ